MKVHQALHGYKQGHQLLASSRVFSPADERFLQYATDSPNSGALRESGVVLKAILPESKDLVFVRIWPAPDGPRPGCVWAHTLIAPANHSIQRLLIRAFATFRRPSGDNFEAYRVPHALEQHPREAHSGQDHRLVGRILAQLASFEGGCATVWVDAPTSLDREISAVEFFLSLLPENHASVFQVVVGCDRPLPPTLLAADLQMVASPRPANERSTAAIKDPWNDGLEGLGKTRQFLSTCLSPMAPTRRNLGYALAAYAAQQQGFDAHLAAAVAGAFPRDSGCVALKGAILAARCPPLDAEALVWLSSQEDLGAWAQTLEHSVHLLGARNPAQAATALAGIRENREFLEQLVALLAASVNGGWVEECAVEAPWLCTQVLRANPARFANQLLATRQPGWGHRLARMFLGVPEHANALTAGGVHLLPNFVARRAMEVAYSASSGDQIQVDLRQAMAQREPLAAVAIELLSSRPVAVLACISSIDDVRAQEAIGLRPASILSHDDVRVWMAARRATRAILRVHPELAVSAIDRALRREGRRTWPRRAVEFVLDFLEVDPWIVFRDKLTEPGWLKETLRVRAVAAIDLEVVTGLNASVMQGNGRNEGVADNDDMEEK